MQTSLVFVFLTMAVVGCGRMTFFVRANFKFCCAHFMTRIDTSVQAIVNACSGKMWDSSTVWRHDAQVMHQCALTLKHGYKYFMRMLPKVDPSFICSQCSTLFTQCRCILHTHPSFSQKKLQSMCNDESATENARKYAAGKINTLTQTF